MIRARSVVLVAAPAAVALATGFLIGYPAEVAVATTLAAAALVSLVTIRELAARAERGAPRASVAGPPPLEQLRQVDKALASAQVSEFAVDRDLRPLLRPIAAMRLARRGIDLDRHPEEARAMLGEPLWELVRANRLRGSNRVAGGIPPARLQSMIERLEGI